MRPQKRFFAILLGPMLAALCTVGCHKASRDDAKARNGSAGEGADRVSTTETHSATIEGRADGGAGTTTSTGRNDYLSAVRREQLQLRARLQEDIDGTDRTISDLRAKSKPSGAETKKLSALMARRQHLEMNAKIVERRDERGWDEL